MWSFLTRRVGAVRVDIAQPFSLQVTLTPSHPHTLTHTHSHQEYLSSAVVVRGSLLEQSHISRRGSAPNLTDSTHRRLVTALSYHIMYGKWRGVPSPPSLPPSLTGSPADITQCSSLTPTSMVAFLLLNQYREVHYISLPSPSPSLTLCRSLELPLMN